MGGVGIKRDNYEKGFRKINPKKMMGSLRKPRLKRLRESRGKGNISSKNTSPKIERYWNGQKKKAMKLPKKYLYVTCAGRKGSFFCRGGKKRGAPQHINLAGGRLGPTKTYRRTRGKSGGRRIGIPTKRNLARNVIKDICLLEKGRERSRSELYEGGGLRKTRGVDL